MLYVLDLKALWNEHEPLAVPVIYNPVGGFRRKAD